MRGSMAIRLRPCMISSTHTSRRHQLIYVVIQTQETRLQKRFLGGCSSPFMRLAQHHTALRAWGKKMSAWSVETRCAPSWHCREARVYGHTTSSMHDIENPPPPVWAIDKDDSDSIMPARRLSLAPFLTAAAVHSSQGHVLCSAIAENVRSNPNVLTHAG